MALERFLTAVALSTVAVLALSGCVSITPFAPSTVAEDSVPQEQDDDFGTVDVYTVLDDGTLDPAASGLTATVWDTFTRVATVDFAAEVMTQYRVGDSASSDTLAYVYQDDDPQYWVLAANLATSDDPTQLVATLIHEYGHILMLATDEVDPAVASCDTIELDEGCANGDSVLLAFQRRFWAPYGEAAPELSNTDADLAWEFYLAHEDDFVSDYAATNAIEDAAETFMTFVLEAEPTSDSTVAKKISFFWGYPELVAIRERIRAEFADDLGLVG